MSDPMDDYDDEEMAEHEPKRRGVSAFASRAVGAVGGAAKAVADSVENTTDKMRIMVDRMDKWAGQGRVCTSNLLLDPLSIAALYSKSLHLSTFPLLTLTL